MAVQATNLPPKGGWRVTNQIDETRPNTSGQYVKGTTVHFVTSNGVSSSVWVPAASFTAAYIKTLISAKVKMLDTVSTLATTGSSK